MKCSWCLLQSLAAAPRPGEAQSEAPSLQPGIFKPEASPQLPPEKQEPAALHLSIKQSISSSGRVPHGNKAQRFLFKDQLPFLSIQGKY